MNVAGENRCLHKGNWMKLDPPMVGRENEQELLLDNLGRAISGEGGLIYISGEAGSGKTRLCEEFEKIASKSDCEVLIGRCIPRAPSPYLPFREAFHDLPSNPLAGSKTLSEQDRERLFFCVLENLKLLSKDQAISIRLEDLHWADSSSIALLHFLARNIRTLRVLIIGTYRPEDMPIESPDGLHPLQESLRVLRREGVCTELHLEALDSGEIKQMVPALLEGTVDPSVLDAVADESRGNPLFAIEVTRLLASTGSIELSQGSWKLRAKGKIPIPLTIREVIIRRTERVPVEERRVLECASVIGERFQHAYVAKALGLDALRVLETLDLMRERAHLVDSIGDEFYFTHNLIQTVTYDEISIPRRRELHLRVGEAIEKGADNEGMASQLSYHFQMANNPDKCIKYSLMAGNGFLKHNAYTEARQVFKTALDLSIASGNFRSRLQSLEGLGDAYEGIGNEIDAAKCYEEFQASSSDPKAITRVSRKLAECWNPAGSGNGDPSKMRQMLDALEKTGEFEPLELGQLYYDQVFITGWMHEYDLAESYCRRAEELFEREKDHSMLAEALRHHCDILLAKENPMEAEKKAQKALDIVQKEGIRSVEKDVLFSFGLINWYLGDFEKSEQFWSKAQEISKELGDHQLASIYTFYRAFLAGGSGDYESSWKLTVESLEEARKMEYPYLEARILAFLAHCYIHLNQLEEAEKLLTEASEKAGSFSPKHPNITVGIIVLANSELLIAKGKVQEGVEESKRAIHLLRNANYGVMYESTAHVWLAEILMKKGCLDHARGHLEQARITFQKIGNSFQDNRADSILHFMMEKKGAPEGAVGFIPT